MLLPLLTAAPLLLSPIAISQEDPAPAVLEENVVVASGAELKLSDVPPAKKGPWKLQDAIGAPDWFQVKGQFRARFEHLWGWAYRFEAYTPPAKRVRGRYAMPLLPCRSAPEFDDRDLCQRCSL